MLKIGKFINQTKRLTVLASAFAAATAQAAPPPLATQAPAAASEATETGSALGFLDSLERSQYLLGNLWGLRSALSRYGITLLIQETSESLGNLTGGSRQSFAYEGLTQVAGISNLTHPPELIKNEWVVGARVNIQI